MSTQKRSYELKERARGQAQTRQRIVDATVALHKERGPAATTVADIARRAGVSRFTVYNHFPRDSELFAACQRQFFTENPRPDLAPALALEEPDERVYKVLSALYRSYRRQEPMTAKVLRDRKALPALDTLLERTLDTRQAELTGVLAGGFEATGPVRKRTRALVALALDFWTWHRLSSEGLTDNDAAQLMAHLVTHTAAGS